MIWIKQEEIKKKKTCRVIKAAELSHHTMTNSRLWEKRDCYRISVGSNGNC